MKNKFKKYASISAISISVALVLMIGLLYGCQDNLVELPETIPNDLKSYFESQDYKELKENFDFKISDFSFDNFVEENPIPEVTIYYVSIQKKNRNGTLAIYSKNNSEVFKSLFSDRSQINNQDEGVISIYTAKNYFVVDYRFEKINETSLNLRINRVGDLNTGSPRLKSGIEFPTSADGWWSCTRECSKIAKEACDGHSDCNFLCEIIDGVYFLPYCEFTLAASCAIYCAL